MKTFSITDVGMVRQVNQDYVYTSDVPIGPLPNLFVVADGMGGHQAGDFASKYTVEVVRQELKQCGETDVEKALVRAIKKANKEIIKKASEDVHLKGMGTTIVVATIVRQMMYFANVGDSRLYLINQGITQLTKDHSLVEEMVRLGGIKPEEAKHHPDKNIITRAIGAKDAVEVETGRHHIDVYGRVEQHGGGRGAFPYRAGRPGHRGGGHGTCGHGQGERRHGQYRGGFGRAIY